MSSTSEPTTAIGYYFRGDDKKKGLKKLGKNAENEDLGIIQSWLIKSKEDERRCPQANWFEVIGTANKCDDHVFRVLEHTDSNNPYSPPVKGGLFLFANDLVNYYGNNLGAISVTVTRKE